MVVGLWPEAMVAHRKLFYAVAVVITVIYNRIPSHRLCRRGRDVRERLRLARPVQLLAGFFPAHQMEIVEHQLPLEVLNRFGGVHTLGAHTGAFAGVMAVERPVRGARLSVAIAPAGFQRGSFRILVATDLASRGIHVQNIAHVINYDLPADAESFIHRAGRTGRAGERGVASTLFARDQHPDLLQLERTLGIRIERMREGGDPSEKTDGASARMPTSQRHGSQGVSATCGIDRTKSAPRPRLVKLPGEVLQAQMEG
ncbi:MAG: helicase-related protein [Terriglobia bacterium]